MIRDVARSTLLAAILLAPLAATAQSTPTAAQLRADLAGNWTGALGYRDYQSNRLFELPVQTTIALVADGVTQVRTSKFDEGEGAAPVWITTVSIDDPRASTVVSASFRAGRAVEPQTETVEVTRYAGPVDWTIVYRQTGTDDDKPADIRVTETRTGSDLLAIKDVRPVGSAETVWQFRNQTRLKRSAAR